MDGNRKGSRSDQIKDFWINSNKNGCLKNKTKKRSSMINRMCNYGHQKCYKGEGRKTFTNIPITIGGQWSLISINRCGTFGPGHSLPSIPLPPSASNPRTNGGTCWPRTGGSGASAPLGGCHTDRSDFSSRAPIGAVPLFFLTKFSRYIAIFL